MWERIKAKRKIIDKLRQYEKDKITEELQKEQFLSSKTDITFLERIIQQCNSNPDLKIEMVLKDGTVLKLKCYNESKKRDFEYLNEETI
jgi:hypothetical protein